MFIQGVHTFPEREIVRLTLFNNFLISVVILRGRKTGVPGEKPSKHRGDQLRQLNSHETQVQVGLPFFQW